MKVVVRVAGKALQRWSSMNMRRSITDAAWTVQMQTIHEEVEIPLFSEMTVELGDQLAFTGHVFATSLSYTADDHSLQLDGRSLSAAIVDCSTPKKTFTSKSLFEIAQQILDPFDLAVFSDQPESKEKFRKIASEDGERIFDFLVRLARYRGLLITTDPTGDVLLTKAESRPVPGARISSKDTRMLRAELSRNGQQLYSEYTAKVLLPSAGLDAITGGSVKGVAKDPSVPLFRPTTITPDAHANRKAVKKRAEWERNQRSGQSSSLMYSLAGWESVPGSLWEPNTLVPVEDSVLGVKGDFLISTVTFQLDEGQGQTVDLVLQSPSAFLAEETPIPVKRDDEPPLAAPITF